MLTRSQLRDLAKFGAGLIAADFLMGAWMLANGFFPVALLGVAWTANAALAWLVFDVFLFMMLVVFGWHIGDKHHTSMQKVFLRVVGALLGVVGLIHLSRILFGWDIFVAGTPVPYWANALSALVTLFLSYASFHFALGKKKE
jgi:uncharacterized protein YacL